MYHVLLVDDEQLDLEAMKQLIPWESLDMQVTGTAKNGFAALQFLERQSVDILITDIKMPQMSGIEMAERVRRLNEQVKIIFMSGYEDFNYARKAIELHASSYALKPVGDRELMELLERVKTELDEDRDSTRLRAQWDHSLPIVKNELLGQWLRGHETEGTLTALNRYGVRWREAYGCVAIIEVDDVAWKLKDYADKDRESLVQETLKHAADWAEEQGCHCCQLGDHRMALLFDGMDEPELPASALSKLVDQIKASSPLTVTVGIGQTVGSGQKIPISYRQALQAIMAKTFLGKSRVITGEQAEGEVSRSTADLESRFEAMFAATASYDLVQIHDSLRDLFCYVHTLKNKMTVANFALYVFSKVENYVQSMKVNVYEVLDIEFHSLDILHEMETIEDIESWLRRKLFAISEYMHLQKQKPNRKLVQDIERYVDERLGSSITLRDAANHFAFSPNYLGYLFKQETGENFSETLTRKRLEKAKELLGDSRLKVYEVADRVGYKNLTYFGRHFKNYYGVSPIEYRKQMGQG